MKNIEKRLLSLAMVLALMAGMLPGSPPRARAEGGATSGALATNQSEITLTEGFIHTGDWKPTVNVTLDLKGHTLTIANGRICVDHRNIPNITKITVTDSVVGGRLVVGERVEIDNNGSAGNAIFELRGGTLTCQNSHTMDGGTSVVGVYYNTYARLLLNGGTITGCPGYGAVTYGDGLYIGGEVTVTNNCGGANGNGNVLVKNGKTIFITGDLGNSRIGITTQTAPTADAPVVLTSGLSGHGDASNFFSDNDAYVVTLNDDGEAILAVKPAASVTGGETTTEYTSFDEALAAWTDGATLTLLSDVTTPSTITVSGTKTLDLNGCGIKLTGSGKVISVGSGANLTLNDSDPDATHKYTINDPQTNGAGLAVVDDINGDRSFTGGYITGGNNTTGFDINARGGGIFVYGGTLTMDGGTLIGNAAAGGGGLYVSGTAVLTHVNFIGNHVTDCGAAIQSESGTLTVEDSEILYNYGETTSGIHFTGTAKTLNVINSTFRYNVDNVSSRNVAQTGVILARVNQEIYLTDVTITDNIGGDNGGITIQRGRSGGTEIHLSGNCVISGNTKSDGSSGNIYFENSESARIVVDNALTNTTPIGVWMTTPGVFTNSGSTGLNDAGKFTSDNAGYAVGKNAAGQLDLRIPPAASVTSGGTTTEYGTLADAVAAWNSASSGATLTLLGDVTTASTISVSGTKTLDLNGYGIKLTGSGKVISIGSGANLTLNDSNPYAAHKYTVASPAANGAGLATVNDADGTMSFTGGYITGGNNLNNNGGAISATGTGKVVVNDCTFIGNLAANGGAVNVIGSASVSLNHTAMIGNVAQDHGGAIYNQGSSGSVTLTDCTVQYNYVSEARYNNDLIGGGGICVYQKTVLINGGTIVNNACVSGNSGGGVYLWDGTVEINGNVIIKDNRVGETE